MFDQKIVQNLFKRFGCNLLLLTAVCYFYSFENTSNVYSQSFNSASKPNSSGLAGALPPAAFPGGETGNDDFRMSIPILNAEGRGLDLKLNLRYKSKIWEQGTCYSSNSEDSAYPCPTIEEVDSLYGFDFNFFGYFSLDNIVTLPSGQKAAFSPPSSYNNTNAPSALCEVLNGNYVCYGSEGGEKLELFANYYRFTDTSGTKFTYAQSASFGYYPTKIEDQNGNYITINYTSITVSGAASPTHVISSVVDTLGKVYNFHYTSEAKLIAITAPKSGGGERQVVRFYYETQAVSTGSLPRPNSYPPSTLLKYIYFPADNSAYKFSYTNYSVIKRVEKRKEFTVSTSDLNLSGQVNNSGNVVAWTEYNYPIELTDYVPVFTTRMDDWIGRDIATGEQSAPVHQYNYLPSISNYHLTVTAPDGTQTTTFKLINWGAAAPNDDPYPADPEEVNIAFFNDNNSRNRTKAIEVRKNGVILSKSVYKWTVQALVYPPASSCSPGYICYGDRYYWLYPRIAKVTSTNEKGQTTTVEKNYTLFNNNKGLRETETKSYGFNNELLNRTVTTYKDSPNYINNWLGYLVESVKFYEGNGATPISRTDYDYDTQPLLLRGTISNHVSSTNTYRGNLTKITKYKNAQNGTGAIVGVMKYDEAGNLVESIDPLGRHKYSDYTDNYSDGINRNTFAFATKLTSPIPDPTGIHGSNIAFETSSKYEFNTGLMTSSTDANGKITNYEYIDSLLRPTRIIEPNGRQNVVQYDDSSTNPSVRIKSQMETDKWSEAVEYFDGIGNSIKTKTVNSKGDVFVETVYDKMRRVKKVTNPFRQGEQKKWTENVYDDLGRVKETITPNGARVETIYNQDVSSNSTFTSLIVKDEAGKLKRAVYNVLGQLIRVDEPNEANQLGAIDQPNQATSYIYDGLGNLTESNQGGQIRTFTYDSLSRLLSSNNPENGLLEFTYDNLGNILTRKDANNVTSTYTYDNLGRTIVTSYSDNTPAVNYYYDDLNIANSKGSLTKIASSVSETRYTAFDIQGRILSSQQITDGKTFTSSYQYGLDGTLIKEIYPSGRVVQKVYDDDGDLLRVFGQAANKPLQTYLSQFTYTASGAISSAMLGNGRWESTVFNDRLQATEIKLGTAQNSGNLWQANFDYGVGDNNGNIKSQTIIVSTVGNTPGFTANQTYEYDSLNRLKSATETINNQENWKQVFNYDRYGNRRFNEQLTSTLPKSCGTQTAPEVCANAQKQLNPNINITDNRLSSAQGYIYDQVGNLKQNFDNQHFFYNAQNKLIEVQNVSNVVIGQYIYDGEGQRVKKISPTENIIFVYNAFGQMIAEYSNASQPNPNPQLNYLTTDHLGSPRIITDATGNVISRRDFLPFGEEIVANESNRIQALGYNFGDSTRQKFTTYERDTETGLDFAQARYYSSKHGRFTSVDPLMASASAVAPQTWNRYAYVGNNPLNIIDPTGMDYFDGSEYPGFGDYNIFDFLQTPSWWYIGSNGVPQFGTGYTAENVVRPDANGALVYPTVDGTFAFLNPLANGAAPYLAGYATAAAAAAAGAAIAAGAAVLTAWAPVAAVLGIAAIAVAVTTVASEGTVDNRPEPVKGLNMSAETEDWIDRQLEGLNEKVPPVTDTATPAPPPIPDGGNQKPNEPKVGVKTLANRAGLPTQGKIRYVPPKNVNVNRGLPRDSQGGYIDRFGNIWRRPRGQIVGERHWDVQLSPTGRTQLGWASQSGNHINVSNDGRILH